MGLLDATGVKHGAIRGTTVGIPIGNFPAFSKTVKMWDAGSGAALQTLDGHSYGVCAVAFSPDGRLLALVDDTVKLWDAGSGAALQTLEGHSKWVNAVTFSPDGRLLASASGDSTVKQRPSEEQPLWSQGQWLRVPHWRSPRRMSALYPTERGGSKLEF
jgi:WD40 repeat protein